MSDENPSFLLTHSQEMQLLADHDVGSMMHLLNEESQSLHEYYTYSEFENGDESSEEKIQFNANIPSEVPNVPLTEVPIPPSLISNEDYLGPYNFQILIKPQVGNNNWVYSEKLNKVFTTLLHPIPIDFKWTPTTTHLYVRATPLYSSPQHAQELVKRCLQHSSPTDTSNLNVSGDLIDHVLRCQDSNALYCGNVDAKMFLNVVVPLGQLQAGTDVVRVLYSFVCNNSCPSGMNRKALEVVYTLEDGSGNVFGRKKVFVRVCSCPKRDKEKEERDSGRIPSRGKKLMQKKPYSHPNTALDTQEYTIPITICGKHNRYRVAKMAYEIITTQLHENKGNAALKANQEQLYAYLKSIE